MILRPSSMHWAFRSTPFQDSRCSTHRSGRSTMSMEVSGRRMRPTISHLSSLDLCAVTTTRDVVRGMARQGAKSPPYEKRRMGRSLVQFAPCIMTTTQPVGTSAQTSPSSLRLRLAELQARGQPLNLKQAIGVVVPVAVEVAEVHRAGHHLFLHPS